MPPGTRRSTPRRAVRPTPAVSRSASCVLVMAPAAVSRVKEHASFSRLRCFIEAHCPSQRSRYIRGQLELGQGCRSESRTGGRFGAVGDEEVCAALREIGESPRSRRMPRSPRAATFEFRLELSQLRPSSISSRDPSSRSACLMGFETDPWLHPCCLTTGRAGRGASVPSSFREMIRAPSAAGAVRLRLTPTNNPRVVSIQRRVGSIRSLARC